MRNILLFTVAVALSACSTTLTIDDETVKKEVLEVEKAFNDMAAQQGVKTAFLEFADKDAALNRGGEIIKGKQAISDHFDTWKYENVSLIWEPDFVEVSKSRDLAYTYGKYEFSALDENGKTINNSGVFHTVWKKQSNGQWKYVYD